MKNNPYVNYMTKSSVVLRKLETENIEELILKDIEESQETEVKTDISHIVELIKKIIFNYYMYGMIDTNAMIKMNKGSLISGLTNGDSASVNEVKQEINDSLKRLKLNIDSVNSPEFEKFLISSATRVKKSLDQGSIDNKILKYQVQ